MATTKEHLLDWLRDAHAMEQAAISILERQSERVESYPEMQKKVQEHLQTSQSQAERVKSCIDQLGGDTSVLKQGVAKLMGNAAAITNAAASDEIVKNAIADYAFEHFEIASYRSLIGAAEELGEMQIAEVCRGILQEEEEMAEWLEEALPTLTRQYLMRDAADVQAKN